MRAFFCLPSLFFAVSSFAQSPVSTRLPEMAARRQRDLESGRWQARHDSLERAYYQAPPYVVVSYYKNLRQLPWSAAMSLYLMEGQEKLMLVPKRGNQFLLPPLDGDSITLGVKYKGREIAFGKIPARYFAHGATVAFGYINHAHFNANPDNLDLEDDILRGMLRTLELARWHPNKKIRGFQYMVTQPRVYGDGMVETASRPLLHKK